jgi:hypothetical protein
MSRVSPNEDFRRMAEVGEFKLDWGGGPTGYDAVHIGKSQKTLLFWPCLGRWALKRQGDCRSE